MLDIDNSVTIPDKIEEIDTNWLERALQVQRPALRLATAEVVDVIHGFSTKVRVGLEYADEGGEDMPATMIVKGGMAEHSHLYRNAYKNENNFYMHVVPRTRMNGPRCYFAGRDDDGRSVVIMEDLNRRGGKGVRWLHASTPLNFQDETRFTDALADFAAEWWQSPEFEPGGALAWLETLYDGAPAKMTLEGWLERNSWNHYTALPRCVGLPRSLKDRDRMARALENLGRVTNSAPRTLAHGDTHLGNLFIDHDGKAGFFDGSPALSYWAKDFTYQLIAGVDIEDRRRWERPLLARYLRRLGEAGVPEVPSFEEAWFYYGCEIAWGLFVFMNNGSTFQTEEVNTANAARFAAAALDHQTFALLGVH